VESFGAVSTKGLKAALEEELDECSFFILERLWEEPEEKEEPRNIFLAGEARVG